MSLLYLDHGLCIILGTWWFNDDFKVGFLFLIVLKIECNYLNGTSILIVF